MRHSCLLLLLVLHLHAGWVTAQALPAANDSTASAAGIQAELAALRMRVEELEGERPAIQLQAFQDDCCSSILCSTKDRSTSVAIGGRIEQDWLWASEDASVATAVGKINDGVFFRRARLHATGKLHNVVDYYAEFEFAPVDNIVFQDVWMQLSDVPWLGHLRAGHLKVPFGLENETSAKHLTFMERSAVHDAFQQEYDPGVMFWNTIFDDNLRYAVAALRFDPRESGQAFGDGEYSFAARLSSAIWHNADDTALVHLGVGFRRNNAIFHAINGFSGFQYRARPEIRNTPRLVDTGFVEADYANFVGLEAACVVGRFSAQAEWVGAYTENVVLGPSVTNRSSGGFYVATSYFLTGEHRPYSRSNGGFDRIHPNQNVSPKDGCAMLLGGAWEAKARYSQVDLTEFNAGKLETVTVGLNWYLIPNAKILVDCMLAELGAIANAGRAELLGLRFNAEF